MVMSVRKSFSLLTTIAKASVPTRNSIGVRPMDSHEEISSSWMARLALAMSVSPATQKRSRPAPEPMLSTVMLPLKPSSRKRSDMRSDNGNTVELPAVMMSPVTFSGLNCAAGSSGAMVGASPAAADSAVAGVGSAAGAQAASRTLATTSRASRV